MVFLSEKGLHLNSNCTHMTSKHLRFEHYNNSDFMSYFLLVSNPQVMKMIIGRPMIIGEARARFNQMLQENQRSP